MSAFRAIAVGFLLIGCLATQAVAGNVFVLPANTFDTTVAVFTDSPFQSSGTFAVPAGALAVFARPDGSRYYVISASSTDTLLVMNSTLTTVLKRVDLGSPARAAGLSPDGKRLLILAGGLYVFDVTTTNDDNITPSPAPNVGVNPGDLAFSLDSKSAFIVSSQTGRLSRYNLENDFVDETLDLNGSPTAVATAPTGVLLVSATNMIYDVDPITATVRTEIALNGLPGKAAFTPDGKYALVPNGAAFVATGLGFLIDMEAHDVAGILPRTGSAPEFVLDQLVAASDSTFYGVSTSTRQMVRVNVNPLALQTTGFVLSNKTGARGLAISLTADLPLPVGQAPQATYAFLSSGAGVSRGTLSTGGVEDRALAVTPGRLVLAGAASTEAPTGSRIFNDDQSVVGDSTTQPLILRVWDAAGRPVFDKEVKFTTSTEGVTFETPTTRTNLDGYALTRVTAPPRDGVVIVQANVQGLATPIQFRITVVGGGGGTGMAGLLMYSGNGQVIPRGFPTEEPLRVRLTDEAGDPVVGATVTWELVEQVSAFTGMVHPATSKTDIDGIANGGYSGPVITPPTTSWLTAHVSASVPGFDPVTFVATTIPEIVPGVWAKPTYNLLAPLGGRSLTGQAGQILQGAVQVKTIAVGGTDTGHGIPNVGVDLASDLDPETNPTASCVGEGSTALSGATGIASCDVRLGGVVGGPVPIRVRVGGGGRDGGTEYTIFLTVTPGPPQITILGGDNQAGGPNTILPGLLSAEISDGFGHKLPGTAVTWNVATPGAVTIVNSSSVADAAGRVSAQVRLGASAGPVQVRLRAGSAEAFFNLSVNVPVASLTRVSGDGQSALLNQAFAAPLVVEAQDQQSLPVGGLTVAFALVSGQATLGSGTAVTGADGRASILVTAGATAGPVVVRATLLEFTVTFNLTVGVPVSAMTKVAGDGQSVAVNQDFDALVVELRDQHGALVQGAAVTFAVINGPATILGNPTVTSTASGRASVTVRAGAAPGAVMVRATSFNLTTTFNLTVTPPGPGLSRNNIRSAISGDLGVTPGGIVAIYGEGIAPDLEGSVVANGGYLLGPLPTSLAGVEVLFGTTNAPIFHVTNSNGQQWVAVQAPFSLTAGGTTSVTVKVGGGSATVEGVEVKNYQPGIFETMGPAAQRWAVLTKEDGSYVTADNPVRSGVDRRLRMYCAGLGQATPALTTNGVGVPGQTLLAQLALYILTTDGSAARVVSAEPMVGVIGVYVLTIDLPAALQTGSDKILVLGVAGPSGAFTYNVVSSIARVE